MSAGNTESLEDAGLKLYVREAAPSDLEENPKNGVHDVILSTEPIVLQELVVAPLFREPLKLVMPQEHRLAAIRRINRSDVLGEQVLTIGEHHLFHRPDAPHAALAPDSHQPKRPVM